MTRYIFPLLFYVLAALCLNVSAGELAWNGHTTPGSTAFRPYYVPSGSKSYDSASPLVRYSGRWTEIHSPAYTGGSLRQTLQVQASVSFTFFGTGIEWFGNRDMYQGISDVYIDRDPVRKVDVWYDGKRLTQQRLFWRYDLRCQKHTLKIVNTGARPGSTHDYATNVDAFVVTGCRNSQRKDDVHAHSSLPPLLLSTEVESANKWTLEQKGSTGVHAMQLTSMVIQPGQRCTISKITV